MTLVGNIYLTWKGKFGNQGVDLNEVSSITLGLESEVLKKSGKQERASQYLSVNSVGRSVDLFFDSVEDCQQWFELLGILVKKEQGHLQNVDMLEVDRDASELDMLTHYVALGKGGFGVASVPKGPTDSAIST